MKKPGAETLSEGKKPYTTSKFHQMEPENNNFQKDDPVPWGQVSGSMSVFFYKGYRHTTYVMLIPLRSLPIKRHQPCDTL